MKVGRGLLLCYDEIMSDIKGPYESGELGTKAVMNLGVTQVVDDASDLESGSLGSPPDANINDVNTSADRDGMVAIVRHTRDIYQRIEGVWVRVVKAARLNMLSPTQ